MAGGQWCHRRVRINGADIDHAALQHGNETVIQDTADSKNRETTVSPTGHFCLILTQVGVNVGQRQQISVRRAFIIRKITHNPTTSASRGSPIFSQRKQTMTTL